MVLELASLQQASKKQQNNPLWTMKAWILTVEVAFIITAIRKKTSRLLRSVGFIRWRPIIIVIYSIIYRVHTRCKFVFAPSIISGRKLSNSITLWKSTSATIFRLFFHLEENWYIWYMFLHKIHSMNTLVEHRKWQPTESLI